MAFSETGVVTAEIVIPELCVKRISARKLRNNCVEKFQIQAALFCQLQIFFEAVGQDNP